jgi:beta-lactamase regulating signal transducer with metallopeptidase domain
MNIDALVSVATSRVIGWAVVHSLWQVSLIALILALVLRALRGRSANLRYAAGCAALAVAVIAPVATAFRMEAPARATLIASPAALQGEPVTLSKLVVAAVADLGVSAASSAAAAGRVWIGMQAEALTPFLPAVALCWLAGVAIFSVRLAREWRAMRVLATTGTSAPAARLTAAARRLAVRLGIRRSVTLLESRLVTVPTVVGWFRPVILVPLSALTGLTPGQFEAIMAHELAHIRRHDAGVNMLQALVETLLFYHPAVWWISRQVRIEREHCCDDLAVGLCGDPVAYARALTSLEAMRDDSAFALAASGGSLLSRIRRIVRRDTGDAAAAPRIVAALTIGAVALAALALPVRSLATVVVDRVAKPAAPQASTAPEPPPAPKPPQAPGAVVIVDAPPPLQPLPPQPPPPPEVWFDMAELERAMAGLEARLDSFTITIPDIDIEPPSIEIPQIDIPPFDFDMPEIDVDLSTLHESLAAMRVAIEASRGEAERSARDSREAARLASEAGRAARSEAEAAVAAARPAIEAARREGRAAAALRDDEGWLNEKADFRSLPADRRQALRDRGVDAERADQMRAAGLADPTWRDLVRLQAAGADATLVREMRLADPAAGAREIARVAASGIDARQVAAYRASGYRDLSSRTLTRFGMFGVTPSYLRSMGEIGEFDAAGMVKLRMFGVDAPSVRELAAAGVRTRDARDLTKLKIGGVDAKFVREVKRRGVTDLSAANLLKLRRGGLDRMEARSR